MDDLGDLMNDDIATLRQHQLLALRACKWTLNCSLQMPRTAANVPFLSRPVDSVCLETISGRNIVGNDM